MNFKNIYLFIAFIVIIGSIQCQNKVLNITSQLNEAITVDINEYLGVTTGYLNVSSNSTYKLTQPLEYYNSANLSLNRKVLAYDEIHISNEQSYQVQIFQYEQISQSTQQYFLSLISISKGKIQEIAQLLLPKDVQYKEVQLLNEKRGILLLQNEITCFLQAFSISKRNEIVFEQLYDLNQQVQNMYLPPVQIGDKLKIITYSSLQRLVQLREISLDGELSHILDEKQACLGFGMNGNTLITQIPNKSTYTIQCQNRKIESYLFEQYIINHKNRNLSLISSASLKDFQQTKIIKDSKFFSNQLYILEQIPTSENQLVLTILTNNRLNHSVDVEVKFFDIQTTSHSMLGFFITSDRLITLISQTEVFGISILSSQNIFRISLQEIYGFEPIFSQRYGNSVELQYQSINSSPIKFKSIVIKTNVPSFTFRQQSSLSQQYTIYEVNTSQNFTLTSSIKDILNISEVKILQQDIMAYQIVNNSVFSFDKEIEHNFIGSNLRLNVSKFTPVTQNALIGTIKTINPVQTIVESIKIDQIKNIYPAFQNLLIIEYYDTISLVKILQTDLSFELIPLISMNMSYFINEVDSNGFFSFQNNAKTWTVSIIVKDNKMNYFFEQITTDCERSQQFKFSSSVSHNMIATLCDNQIKIYQYFVNKENKLSYSSNQIKLNQKLNQIDQIDLRESGQLLITDNYQIISYNIHLNYQIGVIQVPLNGKGSQSGKIILFEESFLLVRNDDHKITIKQFSYNYFNEKEAELMRELINSEFKWNIINSSSIKQIKSNTSKKLSEEFAVIDGITLDNKLVKLYYRMDKVSSNNQLYQSIEVSPGSLFFTSSSFAGLINKQRMQTQFYSIYYFARIQINFNSKKLFERQITHKHLAKITINNDYSFNYYLTIQRDLSESDTTNNIQNEYTQSIINQFNNNKEYSFSNYTLKDQQFQSNFLGWQLQSLPQGVNASITQRLSVQQSQMEQVSDIIEVFPGIMMYCSNKGIKIQEDVIQQFNSQSYCQLIKDETSQNQVQTNTFRQVIYSFQIDYENQSKSILTKHYIQIQNNNQQQVKIISQEQFQLETTLFYYNNLIKIFYDSQLGLIALLKPDGSDVSKVCQLILDGVKMKYQINCDYFNQINTLQIIDVMWFQQGQMNLFISSRDYIYYGFNNKQQMYSTINLKQFLVEKYKLIEGRNFIRQVKILDQSNVLVEYSNSQIFILKILMQYNHIILSEDSLTLYPQRGYKFNGNAIICKNKKQAILLFSQQDNPYNLSYFLYEPYEDMSSEFLIKSSINISQNEGSLIQQNIRLFQTNKNEIISLISNRQQQMASPFLISISDESVMTLSKENNISSNQITNSNKQQQSFKQQQQQLKSSNQQISTEQISLQISTSSNLQVSLIIFIILQLII